MNEKLDKYRKTVITIIRECYEETTSDAELRIELWGKETGESIEQFFNSGKSATDIVQNIITNYHERN